MRRRIATSLALVGGLALSACGGGTTLMSVEGKISNGSEFLAAKTKEWKNEIKDASGGYGQYRLGEDAACYLEYDEEIEQITGLMACGPVRRVDTAADEVWDLAKVGISSDGDKAVLRGISLPVDEEGDEPTLGDWYISQKIAVKSLLDGDGHGRDASNKVAPPKLPALTSEEMEELGKARSTREERELTDEEMQQAGLEEAVLYYPRAAVRLARSVELDKVYTSDGWRVAPKGYKLYEIVLTGAEVGKWASYKVTASRALLTGTGLKEFSESEGWHGVHVIAVKDGTPAVAEVTSLGKTWTMDLVTGAVADSEEQKLWRRKVIGEGIPHPSMDKNRDNPRAVKEFVLNGRKLHAEVMTGNFAVSPWMNEDSETIQGGWAPAGKMWLVFTSDQGISNPNCNFICSSSFDSAKSTTTVTVDGKVLTTLATDDMRMNALLIPADATAVTLDFATVVKSGNVSKKVGVDQVKLEIQ